MIDLLKICTILTRIVIIQTVLLVLNMCAFPDSPSFKGLYAIEDNLMFDLDIELPYNSIIKYIQMHNTQVEKMSN